MSKFKKIGTNYLRRSAKRFLLGTGCRSPFEAVMRGSRTLEHWADILDEERELELQRRSETGLSKLAGSTRITTRISIDG